MTTEEHPGKPLDFIRTIVTEDLASGKVQWPIVTRFPPEPNGFLHIGHAKSMCLNFGIAREFDGRCNLRFDDTNPAKEEQRYIDAIQADVRWMGFEWADEPKYASDYFPTLHAWANELIKAGKAYVDDSTFEEIRALRGTLTQAGKPSPFCERGVDENLDLFNRMTRGEFPDGSKVLRAKIDMASPNMNLRDPVLYRILRSPHPRTGDRWCVYPMYDWAHGQSDWIEGVTHSVCTLEFEAHRPLYNWCLDTLVDIGVTVDGGFPRPYQYEFARLNITHTMMSKRRLNALVTESLVSGWDDPRMPTISGMRRRGYSAASVREFCSRIGVAKRDNTVELALLEHCLRDDLNKQASRVLGVLNPLKVVIENFPEGGEPDLLTAVNNPEDESAGTREVAFTREIYIEREDFMEDPPRKFFRLGLGREVRLRYAYFITCTDVIKNDAGEVIELRCTYDPATRGGDAPDGRKVKGTLHWVSAEHAIDAEVRQYDTLFTKEEPDRLEEGEDFRDFINDESLAVTPNCKLEPAAGAIEPGVVVQFERHGYFCRDIESADAGVVFNRTVGLRDSWGKKKG